uniref:Glutamine synthetase n=1 Tax=Plectus sambesii TaxID=2011161 RepID=A0A914X5I2_9BILA
MIRTYTSTDKRIADRYNSLPGAEDNIFHTYVWIDGSDETLRAKTRVVEKEIRSLKDVPTWHYDGSSTYQATGENSDMLLKPVNWCRDPFFPGGKSKLIMCETFNGSGSPSASNLRHQLVLVAEKTLDLEPWFAFEQEYILLGSDGRPLGFPENGFPQPQGPYYCAVGGGRITGRDISNSHLLACRYAGLAICGTNAEVLLGQWEYQIGPVGALDICDHLWLSRYILERVAEEYGVGVTFDPKPVIGDWNGSGNHCNFSTKPMRENGGIKEIYKAIEKLSKRHEDHMRDYDPTGGLANRRRLTGKHETASADDFSHGEGARTVSIRIPRPAVDDQKGWLEDRRPAANCDPYAVVNRMLRTVCCDE